MATQSTLQWTTGLREVAPNTYAYLQHDGSWGISNAGFLVGEDGVLVIDALLVASMAEAFIGAIRTVTDQPYRHLINTHSHPDHTGGNRLFAGAEIVSHVRCREEMIRGAREQPARTDAAQPALPGPLVSLPRTPALVRMLEMMTDDPNRRVVLPAVTYDDRLTLHYGDTIVELHHYGPAHTFGDTLVYFPQSRALFAGDIGFFGSSTPLAHSGKIGGWLQVIDRVNALDVDLIVPGHGPIGGRRELDDVRAYLDFVQTQARRCFEAGLGEAEAVRSIDLGPYRDWLDGERISPNVAVAYREFRGEI